MRLIFIFRYYGEKKEDAAPNNPKVQQMSSAVLKPIITVTEFTPGNTPDKVNTKKKSIQIANWFIEGFHLS